MGCSVSKRSRIIAKATAIEILDEAEYNQNPEGASRVKVKTDGKVIMVHYRKLNYYNVKSEKSC